MTIYFQHVGKILGNRDFPQTLGTSEHGLVVFKFKNVRPYLDHLASVEVDLLRQAVETHAPDGFQIWGVPSGARQVVRDLALGDWLLLLHNIGASGRFAYVGRVVGRPSGECFELSQHLWGEARFLLIVFLRGELTNYRWHTFCEQFGYRLHWNPAGQTYPLTEQRLAGSPFGDEAGFLKHFVADHRLLESSSEAEDEGWLDDAELDQAGEGLQLLRSHLRRERSARLIARFKRRLVDFSCRICGFNFESVYGAWGRDFVEAHHIKPISEMTPGERTSIDDLLPVCSNCHRMLHRRQPAVDWRELRDTVIAQHAAVRRL